MKHAQETYTITFQIGGITVQLQTEFLLDPLNFSSVLQKFLCETKDSPDVKIFHSIGIPNNLSEGDFGEFKGSFHHLHIYENQNEWVFVRTESNERVKLPDDIEEIVSIAYIDRSHRGSKVLHRTGEFIQSDNVMDLFSISSDMVLFGAVLADFQACYFHSCGMHIGDTGFLFMGHSGAGKSTMAKIMAEEANLLCDDRIIVRKWQDNFKIHGTWNHGELPYVSADEAELKAIFFLVQDKKNNLSQVTERKEIYINLLKNLVLPVTTQEWYNKIFGLFDLIIDEVPCYYLHFNKKKEVVNLIKDQLSVP